jgi:hypothetical protein
VRTDSSGAFYFSLPDLDGSRDIFLCAEHKVGFTPSILVDNDFCPIAHRIKTAEFGLSEAERSLAYDLAVNFQVSSYFPGDTIPETSVRNEVPFYGESSQVLIIDKYIDLPTLEEYFNELPVSVKVRKSQGKKRFIFMSTQAEMMIYDPLVLIDWVAVDDPERVLAVYPQNIASIELVNSPYIKGNIIYGGIISIHSKRGDFAGIDLPASGMFINYSFLHGQESKIQQDHPDNIPDARNTVFWEPALVLDDRGSAEISFMTPDTPGRYEIVVRGIGKDGRIVSGRAGFEVVK